MAEKIINGNILDQFRQDYTVYALYAQMHRSVPDFKDGLLPVQRRVVYAAYEDCHAFNLMKSANVVGQTMGNYHPHGDSSIQGALYKLSNWYQTKYPLFDGRGNFGNTFENVPAAARYTEVKLSKFSLDCLIDDMREFKETVDWISNYDNRTREPVCLPSKVPLLLLNGSMGICVGDKVDIPSHNINEVIDATIHLIKNPNSKVVLVPDHCQKCEIVNTDWKDICDKGFGNYKVRGVIEIGDYNGKHSKYKGRKVLRIRSCPNLTFLDSIVEKIESMIKENKIIGIEDTEEESKVNDMNFNLILKPGTDPNFIREAIYKNTTMEQTARVNFKVLDVDNLRTMRVSYTGYLKGFIEFRKITKLRYFENKLQQVNTRLHEIENYIWAIESGKIDDQVIKMIRNQKTVDDNELMETLIKKCKFTDLQARFIMNLETKKLSQGWYMKFVEEKQKLIEIRQRCIDMVSIPENIENSIIQELKDIKAKYGEPRKCVVIDKSVVEGIPGGEFKITLSKGNMIKKIGVNDNVTGTKAGDSICSIIIGDNTKNLLVFSDNGKVFNVPIGKIPFTDKGSAGIDIRILNKYITASPTCVIYEPVLEKFKKGFIIALTKKGYIKKMTVTDFLSVPPSGLVYSKIDDEDSIIDILLFGNNSDIVVYNKQKALRMSVAEIPLLKRNTRGNMSMGGTSEVDGLSVISHDTTEIVAITERGYINKVLPDVINTGRSKRGTNVIKLLKGDSIVSVLGINSQSVLRCLTSSGEKIDIKCSDIPAGSSISTGVKMIPAKSGNVLKCYIC